MPSSALLVLMLVSPAEGLIEEIPAVVEGRPVMLSEVKVMALVKGRDLKQALEDLIDEELMFREASRFPQGNVTSEEEDKAYRGLAEKVGPGATENDLRRLARREQAILQYLAFRFRGSVRIEAEELHRAYEAEYKKPGAPPFEAVSQDLRDRLEKEQVDQKIEAWVRDLRSSAEIRYNTSFPSAHP